jgi:monofunctional biosynthetic peptidoglycan transglycosylase
VVRLLTRGVLGLAVAGGALFTYIYLTLPDVRPLARTNPRTTAFMELRRREAAAEGRKLRHVHYWVPYSRISHNLKRAVLVAEDSGFWEHDGIDLEQMRESIEINWEQGRAVRGGSTITQQLAKNLYLSPSRNPIRKVRELIIARRLEAALSKARILEIYLNVIEWGDGVWGAEAAARTYFGISASAVEPEQAALLAGAIINPRVHSPASPNRRLARRQRLILARMGSIVPPVPTVAVSPLPANATPIEKEPTEELPAVPPGDRPPPPPTPDPVPVPCPVPPCAKLRR